MIPPALPNRVRDPANETALPVDVFTQYAPPFDLRSDLLLVAAWCPAPALRRAFPGVPFLSVAGRTPLVIWFSRIKEVCYTEPGGERTCMGGPGTLLYNELNVAALLRERAFFVPGIYATSALTIRTGHRYGMPKQPTVMRLQATATRFAARVADAGHQSFVRARLVGTGRVAGAALARLWPRQAWPARFPSGGQVRALIQATPRVQLALIGAGRLALAAAWLPRSVPLLPLGLYLPDQQMQLPPP